LMLQLDNETNVKCWQTDGQTDKCSMSKCIHDLQCSTQCTWKVQTM